MARSPDVDARRTECPTGSTQAALEITVSWEDSDKDLELHVIEPGGTEVYEYSSNKLGVSRRTPKGASCTSPANAASKITPSPAGPSYKMRGVGWVCASN